MKNGFSLLDLLIVLAIVAIITTIGVPSFQSTVTRSNMKSDMNVMRTMLNLAKVQAVSSSQYTIVCPVSSSTSTTCVDDWNTGTYLLFVDTDYDGVYDTPDSTKALSHQDRILKVETLSTSASLTHKMNVDVKKIEFDALGMYNGDIFEFFTCSSSMSFGIAMEKSGAIRPSDSTVASCI